MAILTANVPEHLAGMRLDQALACLFAEYSRSQLQTWVKAARVRVDGQTCRAKDRVLGGEYIELDAETSVVVTDCAPQAIPLSIVQEDEDLLIVDKPAGFVVHPGAGNREGTLQNALLHHCPALAQVPRAGIVHRLDKDTTGLLVIAKNLPAHAALVEQLERRAIGRSYFALVQGYVTAGGTIDAPLARHPTDRTRYQVRDGGRAAITHYRIHERFAHYTLLRVQLETGRTHQIRVHLAHLRHPLVGDPVYGGRLRLPPACPERLAAALRQFKRQALHAAQLELIHPRLGTRCRWQAPLPVDLQTLLDMLRDDDPYDA